MRNRRKRDIAIELTSLLDVIMIMIFMLMGKNNSQYKVKMEETESRADALEAENNELSSQLDEALAKLQEGDYEEVVQKLNQAEARVEALDYMNEVITVFNIKLENSYGDTRNITYGINSGEADSQSFEIDTDVQMREVLDKLKNEIVGYDELNLENKPFYAVFSYDPDKVYRKDFNAIDDTLNAIERETNNSRFEYHTTTHSNSK